MIAHGVCMDRSTDMVGSSLTFILKLKSETVTYVKLFGYFKLTITNKIKRFNQKYFYRFYISNNVE